MMSLARPKSQIFTSFPSQMRTFLAARSRCTHCRGDTEDCHCKRPSHSLRTQPSSSNNPFLGLQGQESPHVLSGISFTSGDNHALTTSRATTFLLFSWTASSVTATAIQIQQEESEQPSREGIARAGPSEGT